MVKYFSETSQATKRSFNKQQNKDNSAWAKQKIIN